MTRRPTLRAVSPEDRPSRPQKSLKEAVVGGDYLEILIAQRQEIAESIPLEKGPAKAALHRQLTLVAKEIESLRVKESEDVEFGSEAADDFDAAAI